MDFESLDTMLLLASAVLLTAIVAVRLTASTQFPTMLVYLAFGVGLGTVPGLRLQDAELALILSYTALILILIEGGLSTRWNLIRPVVAPAALLATVGAVVSVTVIAVAVLTLFPVSLTWALLLAAVLSVTDAAAIFSVLRGLNLPNRITGLLEAESGFNDAPVLILVVALTQRAIGESDLAWWALVLLALAELAGGVVVGWVIAAAGSLALRRMALPSAGLYPLAAVCIGFMAFGLASVAHASGFMAAYIAALTLGNSRTPHGAAVRSFAEGLGWLAQISLFVMLGLMVQPDSLGSSLWPATIVGLVMVFIARPVSVAVSVLGFGFSWREKALMSWAGLRGAVPIVLTTIPLAADVPGSQALFNVVFLLVVIYTLVQAPTLPAVARWLKVPPSPGNRPLDVDSSPLGAMGAELMTVPVSSYSLLHGVEIFELRLPEGAKVTLILRGGQALVPTERTTLNKGDKLLLVTTAQSRTAAEERLSAIHQGGRLATWHQGAKPEARSAYPWTAWRKLTNVSTKVSTKTSAERRH